MSTVHLECKPDEVLVMKLGIPRKKIVHHDGKSRVYSALRKATNTIAIVDEDPDPNPEGPKYTYESELDFVEEKHGIKRYADNKRSNTVLVLKVKLEDWIISAAKNSKVDMTRPPYSLPDNGNGLHRVINDRLQPYEKLLTELLAQDNRSLLTLQQWLANK